MIHFIQATHIARINHVNIYKREAYDQIGLEVIFLIGLN